MITNTTAYTIGQELYHARAFDDGEASVHHVRVIHVDKDQIITTTTSDHPYPIIVYRSLTTASLHNTEAEAWAAVADRVEERSRRVQGLVAKYRDNAAKAAARSEVEKVA